MCIPARRLRPWLGGSWFRVMSPGTQILGLSPSQAHAGVSQGCVHRGTTNPSFPSSRSLITKLKRVGDLSFREGDSGPLCPKLSPQLPCHLLTRLSLAPGPHVWPALCTVSSDWPGPELPLGWSSAPLWFPVHMPFPEFCSQASSNGPEPPVGPPSNCVSGVGTAAPSTQNQTHCHDLPGGQLSSPAPSPHPQPPSTTGSKAHTWTPEIPPSASGSRLSWGRAWLAPIVPFPLEEHQLLKAKPSVWAVLLPWHLSKSDLLTQHQPLLGLVQGSQSRPHAAPPSPAWRSPRSPWSRAFLPPSQLVATSSVKPFKGPLGCHRELGKLRQFKNINMREEALDHHLAEEARFCRRLLPGAPGCLALPSGEAP
ncbi:uncharacterized protein LOC128626587 [Artibeus jamaicensis]|uniref:uncharacterized protein LOC128626587 n=1 Tax=Artibeus jamaicensis TaxID=9417 RepID=UPI00235AF619|nr:uncharacterized protein LOC128626587 [Artibeus jamaicensis]